MYSMIITLKYLQLMLTAIIKKLLSIQILILEINCYRILEKPNLNRIN